MTTPIGRMGGKSKIAKRLINEFPKDYKIYVEPFFGAGNIFFRIPEKAEINIINDLDEDIFTIMKGLQENSKYINDNINRENITKEEFKELLKKKDPISLIEINKKSFFSQGKTYSALKKEIKTDFIKFSDKLKDVIILNKPFEEVIKSYDSKDTFFYLDPPYSESFRDYKHQVKPQDLFNSLEKIKGKFMLSYDDSPLIRELFKKYNISEIITSYQGTQHIVRREKKELVITNFVL
jgi:DNA adenine methylase